jgi:hypothetical protein
MQGDPMAGAGGLEEGGRGTFVNMLFVSGILALALSLPWVVIDKFTWNGARGARKKE